MTDTDDRRPPTRRLRLTLELGADDLPSMASELRHIAHDFEYERREARDSTSGGSHAGYHLTVVVTDPEMTAERYREELLEWVAGRRVSAEEARRV